MNIPLRIKNKMKDHGAVQVCLFFVFLMVIVMSSCEKTNDPPKYSPPSDHVISKDGSLHKSGLDQPLNNCTSCHGSELDGGTSGVSCYECHGKKW